MRLVTAFGTFEGNDEIQLYRLEKKKEMVLNINHLVEVGNWTEKHCDAFLLGYCLGVQDERE